MMSSLTCLWRANALLGEGPLWVSEDSSILWVDILSKRLHRQNISNGSQESWGFDTEVSSIARRAQGGYACTTRSGFAHLDLPSGKLTTIADVESDLPSNRFNDGKIDAKGRFWAGSMDNLEADATGSLYCLDSNHSVTRHDENYVITNGPAFSKDGSRLFHTDTLKREIYAFDLNDQGKLSNKRIFARIPDDQGYPDGMTVDSEDCLWVCHFGGNRITRFSPEGETLSEIPMPVSNITSCTFGGPKLDTLFITTARKGLSEKELTRQPLAGSLFSCKPGVVGLPTPYFNG